MTERRWPRPILAVITDIKGEEFYEFATELGKLKALYTRNQFTLRKENFLSIEEVGTEEISVREVVNKLSLVGGQGFRKCNCSKKCTTKVCLCKSANLLCNSKCHNSQTAVISEFNYDLIMFKEDRLCGLVVRVSGYRYRGPGFDPRRYQIF